MEDRRQTRSLIGPNGSTIKGSEEISLDEIMASAELDKYVDLLRDTGIRSVNELSLAPSEQLLSISSDMSYWDKAQFEKLCRKVRECFKPEDLKLREVLDSIGEAEHYSLFSAQKIEFNELLKFTKDDYMKLGLSELNARFLEIKLNSSASKNLSYAAVLKHSGSFSSSSTVNSDKSPIVDSEVNTNEKCIQQSITAEELLRNLGLDSKFAPEHHTYEELIATMDKSEQIKLASIAIGLAVNSNGASPHISNDDIEMLELDEQMPVQQPKTKNIENAIRPTEVAKVEAVKRIRSTPRKALNILLLGETGVGKSTFINAFANYVNHETLYKAKNKMLALIPSSFSVSDDNYVDHKVKIGSQNEQNERSLKCGESATQSCKSYVFPSKHGALRIIDTPGVGDTRGEEQDRLNFNNILTYISQYPELNAICILLKPNCSRLTAGFRLCLIQLLNNLEKSASLNIIFVFTNARSTFYQPGDTKPVLEQLLREIEQQPPYIKIKFDHSTSYCVDNESFRFLAAITNGLDFLNESAPTIEESWKVSVNECKRLLDYILTLKPHQMQGTVSISQARRLISDLSGPVADIILEICLNLTRLDEQKLFLEENRNSNESISSLKNKLKTKVLDIYYKNLPYPQTVCASPKCFNDDYLQVCHDECYLMLQVSERCGDPNLRDCSIFSDVYGKAYTCRVCKCSWKDHMRITRKKMRREVEREDMGIKVLLQKVTTINEAIEAFDHPIKSNEEEIKILVDTMAYFTTFQNLNSITGCGDPFRDILSDNLRMEKYKYERVHANNDGAIEKLTVALQNYDVRKNKLVVEHTTNKLTAEKVFQSEECLYKLPLNGTKLLALKSSVVGWDFDHGAAEYAVETESDLSTKILQSVDAYFLKQ